MLKIAFCILSQQLPNTVFGPASASLFALLFTFLLFSTFMQIAHQGNIKVLCVCRGASCYQERMYKNRQQRRLSKDRARWRKKLTPLLPFSLLQAAVLRVTRLFITCYKTAYSKQIHTQLHKLYTTVHSVTSTAQVMYGKMISRLGLRLCIWIGKECE